MGRDAAQGAVLFKPHVHRGHRLPLLPGDAAPLPYPLRRGWRGWLPAPKSCDSSSDAFTSRTALSRCDLLHLVPIELEIRGSTPSPAMARRLCSTRFLICRSTKTSGTGNSCASTSLSTILFLASCCASYWRWPKMPLRTASRSSSSAVIAQILREFVVQLGQFLLAHALQRGVELDRLAGQTLRRRNPRDRRLRIPCSSPGRQAAQVFGEASEAYRRRRSRAPSRPAFTGSPSTPADAFERHHRVIAIFHGRGSTLTYWAFCSRSSSMRLSTSSSVTSGSW